MAIENITITTIVDNAVQSGGLLAEWGFSLLIETDTENILFDCGSTPTPFFHNVNKLNINLSSINTIVLSHGHNDHTGNLDGIIQTMSNKPQIILGAGAWKSRFYEDSWAGIPQGKNYITSLGCSLKEITGVEHISEDIIVINKAPQNCEFEAIDTNLFIKDEHGLVQDSFEDELALVLKKDDGLIIITGCAHRGIVNIIEYAKLCTGIEKVHAVIGGSHLMKAKNERIEKTLQYFQEINPNILALSHCTGDKASTIFAYNFPENFIFNKAGLKIEL